MSNSPEPINVFEVGQWISAASDFAQPVALARFQMDGVAIEPGCAPSRPNFS